MSELSAGGNDNPLSEREMEVARLLSTGASNAEIARELVISPHTVKVHLRNIFEKLQVNSRTEASMLLIQRGWVIVPGVELAQVEAAPAEPPPPPEPPPLENLPLPVARWQAPFLVGALLLSLALVLLPNMVSSAQAPLNLLTDAGQPLTAPASVRLEPRWEMRTPLQAPLSRLAMVALNNHLYAVGGETSSGEAADTVAVYDLDTNEWSQATPLPQPLANAALAAANGRLFVAGGAGPGTAASVNGNLNSGAGAHNLSDRLYALDTATGEWSDVGSLPEPLAGAALVTDSESLYLIGGWDGHNMRDEIWRYPIGAAATPGSWQLLGHLSTPRAFLGAAMVGGEIYIAGGYDGQRELDLAEVFTPASGERRQLPSMGTARGGLSLVYDGLALYALGGGWTRSISTHERYDTVTNAWSNFPSPIQNEWRNLGAAAVDGHLYLVGGWSGTPLDTHLEYQSSFRALLPVISNPSEP
jgi:DNA-binding CsgD family transcriptional regulator